MPGHTHSPWGATRVDERSLVVQRREPLAQLREATHLWLNAVIVPEQTLRMYAWHVLPALARVWVCCVLVFARRPVSAQQSVGERGGRDDRRDQRCDQRQARLRAYGPLYRRRRRALVVVG